MAIKKRILGKTSLNITEMGFGGIPIQRISEDEAIKVVRHCYELGINYFDTARGYTTSEERIGKALEEVRENVYIASKSHARTSKDLWENLKTTLNNLRTDYLDVYQLHNVNEESWKFISSPNGALEAIKDAKKEGIIKHIGITSHSPAFLIKMVEEQEIFETIMVGYNFIAQQPAEILLPLCKRKNVGTIIMKPFGGGAFTNASTALKFILVNKNVSCTIPGMLSVEEVEENVKICSESLELSEEEKKIIEEDRKILGEEFCAACDYCQPCPSGIPISFVLRTELSSLRRMGWTESLIKQTQDTAQKVDACLQCGVCEIRCPYQLPIRKLLPEKMERLKKLSETRSIP
ncbi:aldo/keto reductase [Candidatus Bathyarchaeota archaeon]|nr:aldo/keto reductase [Candidatus Bathyarchaeota archaeon]